MSTSYIELGGIPELKVPNVKQTIYYITANGCTLMHVDWYLESTNNAILVSLFYVDCQFCDDKLYSHILDLLWGQSVLKYKFSQCYRVYVYI